MSESAHGNQHMPEETVIGWAPSGNASSTLEHQRLAPSQLSEEVPKHTISVKVDPYTPSWESEPISDSQTEELDKIDVAIGIDRDTERWLITGEDNPQKIMQSMGLKLESADQVHADGRAIDPQSGNFRVAWRKPSRELVSDQHSALVEPAVFERGEITRRIAHVRNQCGRVLAQLTNQEVAPTAELGNQVLDTIVGSLPRLYEEEADADASLKTGDSPHGAKIVHHEDDSGKEYEIFMDQQPVEPVNTIGYLQDGRRVGIDIQKLLEEIKSGAQSRRDTRLHNFLGKTEQQLRAEIARDKLKGEDRKTPKDRPPIISKFLR